MDKVEMPAGRELDALVAKFMENPGEEYAYASNNDGKSGCAFTDRRDGPWYTIRELEEWLAERQAKGSHLDYKIVRSVRYPHYSTDIGAAWEVVEKLKAQEIYWSASYKRGANTAFEYEVDFRGMGRMHMVEHWYGYADSSLLLSAELHWQ